MASPNLSEIITTTLRNRSGTLADNFSDNNALIHRLNTKGNVRPFSGGRTIVEELAYQENGSYTRYSGYDPININPQDVFTAAEFDIKQAAISVSISGLEELQNSGKEAIIDLLEQRIKNAEKSMLNNLSADCYSDGTADSSKQIGGLQLLVADLPTSGTVGGIDRATWTFWQNHYADATSTYSAAATAALMQSYMNRSYMAVSRGRDHPDLIIADNNYFRLYWESLQAIQRITNDKMASAGFDSIKYHGGGADVVFDGGVGGACPTNHMYFLNTDYIALRPHRGRNMDVIGSDRMSTNQDAMVRLIGWAGNMTTRGPQFQSVLKD